MVEVFIAGGEGIDVVDAARDYKLCLAGSDDPMNQEGCSTCVGVAGTDLMCGWTDWRTWRVCVEDVEGVAPCRMIKRSRTANH